MWSHYHHLERSLRMRCVTWPITGGKNDPHFWNPWPQFTYSLCHFQGATTKIKLCYMRKIAFSHCEGYKVHCACTVSHDLCIGDPPKLHVTIFLPRTVYSLYNLYGIMMTIKGSLYRSISMSKSVPKMAVFRKFKGLHINCGHQGPKRHILGRNDVFWRIFRKNPFRGV